MTKMGRTTSQTTELTPDFDPLLVSPDNRPPMTIPRQVCGFENYSFVKN